MPNSSEPLVNLYDPIAGLFWLTSNVFFASFDIRNAHKVPKDGEPTILLYNHSNSLTDAVVVASRTPRRVCLTTKDTTFKIPVFGTFIKYSGAIPVYRRKEHGKQAASFNADSYRAIYQALYDGKCVGLAPEGVSSFRSYSFKFKTGATLIALEAIIKKKEEENDESFAIYFQPATTSFTHREKFRSDVCFKFLDPIKVDYKLLLSLNPEISTVKAGEFSDIKKDVAVKLTDRLEKLFHRHILSSPDWKSRNLAITATRIHYPFGTGLSLNTYFNLLHGWLDVLKARKVDLKEEEKYISFQSERSPEAVEEIDALYLQLKSYQILIDTVKVKDERFRRLEVSGGRRNIFKTLGKLLYRALILTVIIPVSLPGLVLWSPAWYVIKRKESELRSRGKNWVDSIAEHKMMFGLFSLLAIAVGSTFVKPPFSLPRVFMPLLTTSYLGLTMRLYEEAVSCARSMVGITRLYFLEKSKLQTILAERKKCREAIASCLKHFPEDKSKEIEEETGEDVRTTDLSSSVGEVQRPFFWENLNIFRRRKKDWNEILRLDDHATMDYVE